MTQTTTEMRSINATGDIFIIPNHGGAVSGYWLESTRREIIEIAKLNGLEDFNETCNAFEVWISSDDLSTENLNCHGGRFGNDRIECRCSLLPAVLFENVKEGDSIEINLPAAICSRDEHEPEDIIVKITLTAKQLEYRYRSFGRFEEVFQKVLR